MAAIETRFSELRQDADGRLSGTVLKYGDVASVGGISERFESAAFGDAAALDIVLNRQHDRRVALARTGGGGLTLTDSTTQLTMAVELPDTADARDTLALVKAGVLRGLSIEFRAVREAFEHGVRVISEAVLTGLAVVDKPAYSESTVVTRQLEIAESRQTGERIVTGEVPYGEFTVVNHEGVGPGKPRKLSYKERCFAHSLNQIARDITLGVYREQARQLASRKAGSLTLTDSPTALKFRAVLPPENQISLIDDAVNLIRSDVGDWGIEPQIQIPPQDIVSRPSFIVRPETPGSNVYVQEMQDVSLRGLRIVPRGGVPNSKVQVRHNLSWL